MKIVIALDKFKGSVTAARAGAIVRDAILAVRPDAEIVLKPMADGGEGTAGVIHAACGGEWIEQPVTGPLPQMATATRYLWLAPTKLAVIEMASASGLTLLSPAQRNPLMTTTLGTGELIRDAVERGASTIWLGVGGSATVDGGVGAAMALGWKFLDAAGQPVGLGGGELLRIATILPAPFDAAVKVLCDVDNPLCGEHGAARVFGPQKGASPKMVAQLDAGLAHLARIVEQQIGKSIADLPGAGAAGGLAGGAAAFFHARLVAGADKVMEIIRLDEALAGADWVITGEGCFDEQSLRGKVVSGVMRLAQRHGVKVAVLAGSVKIADAPGIEIALATKPDSMPLAQALQEAEALLATRAQELAEHL